MKAPDAARRPWFRALEMPPFGFLRSRTRGSRAAQAAAISNVASVEPSSMTMSSRSVNV